MPVSQTHESSKPALADRECWRAVQERDRRYDGVFVYGVLSTRIYCRPGCPARRPARERVVFFSLPQAAERLGFRPCKRCHPQAGNGMRPGFRGMIEACRYIESHLEDPLSLRDLSGRFGLSRFAFQRTFRRVVGLTPRAYTDACRVGLVKRELRSGRSVADALYGAGYGSSSRLYERALVHFGMTPSTYRKGGPGMEINYAISKSPLGWVLVAATRKGLCAVRIGKTAGDLERELKAEFPQARLNGSHRALARWVKEVVARVQGQPPQQEIPLDIQGTAFQRRVWEALRRIPYGSTQSYRQVARAIHQPKAVRAVANACGANPVAIVIPCHRVIRSDGSLGGYGGGIDVKQRLLDLERQGSSQ